MLFFSPSSQHKGVVPGCAVTNAYIIYLCLDGVDTTPLKARLKRYVGKPHPSRQFLVRKSRILHASADGKKI